MSTKDYPHPLRDLFQDALARADDLQRIGDEAANPPWLRAARERYDDLQRLGEELANPPWLREFKERQAQLDAYMKSAFMTPPRDTDL